MVAMWEPSGLLFQVFGSSSPPGPLSSAAPRGKLAHAYIHEGWWPRARKYEVRGASSISRSHALMDPGQASFLVWNDDPQIASLKTGDLLVIESPFYEPWVGPIIGYEDRDTPAMIEVRAAEDTSILDKRQMPQELKYTGAASSTRIFRELIGWAQTRGYTGFQLPVRSALGPPVHDFAAGAQSALSGIRQLHDRTNWEWWVNRQVSPAFVDSIPMWGKLQGFETDLHLYGAHVSDRAYDQDMSQINSAVFAVGDFGAHLEDRQSGAVQIDDGVMPWRGDVQAVRLQQLTQATPNIPPGLRNERTIFGLESGNADELYSIANRNLIRPLQAAEKFNFQVPVGVVPWIKLRIGNYFTMHAKVRGQQVVRRSRVIAAQPDEETGILQCVGEVAVG